MKRARTNLPSGSTVDVRLDNGSVVRTRTRSEPWKAYRGTWIVMLESVPGKVFSGGYHLDRVTEVSP